MRSWECDEIVNEAAHGGAPWQHRPSAPLIAACNVKASAHHDGGAAHRMMRVSQCDARPISGRPIRGKPCQSDALWQLK